MRQVAFYADSETIRDNAIFITPPGQPPTLWTRFRQAFADSGYNVETDDRLPPEKSDIQFFGRMPTLGVLFRLLRRRKLHRSVCQLFEPPVVMPLQYHHNARWFHRLFGAVITWDDDLVTTGGNYHKGFYPMYPMSTAEPAPPFAERKLLTNISGNKESAGKHELYSRRVEAIRYMEQNHPEDFDLYGTGWTAAEYPSFKGTIPDKLAVLRQYRFSMCFENMSTYKGYVTEKIFDCLQVNAVPVYWGAENITDYVPADCFIDFRQFKSYEALYRHIEEMDEAAWLRYAEARNRYAVSAQYAPFQPQAFIDNALGVVKQVDAGVRFSYPAAWLAFARLALWQGWQRAKGACGHLLARLHGVLAGR